MARQATEPDEIAGNPIPASRLFFVMMSPWVIHRNPNVWPEPERFDPERFSPSRSAGRPKHAYIPFGAGQRLCIGNAFAWMEAMLLLATLASRFQPRLLPDAPVTFEPLVTLRPKDGLRMRIEPRPALSATG
jgi:cytochrome P450